MAKIPEIYPSGSTEDLTLEQLYVMLQDMYKDIAVALNRKVDLVERDTDGQTSDTFLSNGTININTSTLKVEMLTEHNSSSSVTWTQLS